MTPAVHPTPSAAGSAPARRLLVPAPAALVLAGLWWLLGIAASFVPGMQPVWAGAALLLVMALLSDAAMAWLRALPRVRRRVPQALAIGVEIEVEVDIENEERQPLHFRFHDHAPDGCAVRGLPIEGRLGAGEGGCWRWPLRPLQRGSMAFGALELWIASPLGLFRIRARYAAAEPVRVYPNFAALRRYALLATDHRLSQAGLLLRRRRGEGTEFQQLREYREGDTPRQIDWKASARMRRLVSREYREERDQQILLLLDCSRRMHARDGALSHLDHALDAALLLAYVALRQGDAVGLMTFGGIDRYLPPRKSRSCLDGLLEGTLDLKATLAPADYLEAAIGLSKRQRKRSLVVILSNLRDEDDDTLLPALDLLRKRHLVVVASLRERILEDLLRAPVDTLDDALAHAATADYLRRRRRHFARLAAAGLPALDVEPAELPIALVNRYTELKRRGAI